LGFEYPGVILGGEFDESNIFSRWNKFVPENLEIFKFFLKIFIKNSRSLEVLEVFGEFRSFLEKRF